MRQSSAIVVEQAVAGSDRRGHRERLYRRFDQGGIAALHDYEIMELVLTLALPRVDTKSVAKQLLRRFKTVSAVLNAEREELRTIGGIGARAAIVLRFLREFMAYCLREQFARRPIVSHRKDIESYLRFTFGYRRTEYTAVVFLDNGKRIIDAEIVAEGTVNQCAVYPRAIMKKALACDAGAFIVAHNHPGGGVSPSEADWRITRQLQKTGALLDVPLLDHILIAGEAALSLREMNRWDKK